MEEDRVVAYSGCSYANEPREFYLGGVHHRISRVLSARVEQSVDPLGQLAADHLLLERALQEEDGLA